MPPLFASPQKLKSNLHPPFIQGLHHMYHCKYALSLISRHSCFLRTAHTELQAVVIYGLPITPCLCLPNCCSQLLHITGLSKKGRPRMSPQDHPCTVRIGATLRTSCARHRFTMLHKRREADPQSAGVREKTKRPSFTSDSNTGPYCFNAEGQPYGENC